MDMSIRWKTGYQAKIDPGAAYKELEHIRSTTGSITAIAVVDRAKSRRNPLHRVFEWDDTKAGEEWRLYQARNMIRSLELERSELPGKPYKAYSIVTTQPVAPAVKSTRVYQSTEEALKDPVMRSEILGSAIRDALAFRRKYAALQELAAVFRVLDDLLENYG